MMTLRMTKTGETVKENDSYALRLIEQGKAVVVHDEPKKLPAKEKSARGDAAQGSHSG